MNEQDKFECRHQEIHDEHTGVTVTFGTHAGSDNDAHARSKGKDDPDGHPRKGLRWMRIAVPNGSPDDPTIAYGKGGWRAATGETKTSTITFGPDGQALKILPHVQASTGYHESAPPPDDETASQDKVDKKAKHAKK